MSTQLTIPSQKPIVPKPTKTEIISAMVEIARQKFNVERSKHQAALDEFDSRLKKHARKIVRKHISTGDMDVVCCYDGDEITIKFTVPHEMGERHLRDEREALRRSVCQVFDERRTRDDIRRRMEISTPNKQERIDCLLSDPAARRHLELALESLYAEPEVEAIEV